VHKSLQERARIFAHNRIVGLTTKKEGVGQSSESLISEYWAAGYEVCLQDIYAEIAKFKPDDPRLTQNTRERMVSVLRLLENRMGFTKAGKYFGKRK
jgi:hypothetical protein